MGRAEQEIDILERISQILGDGLEMGQVFQRAMAVLCEKLDVQRAELSLAERELADMMADLKRVGSSHAEAAWREIEKAGGVRPESDLAGELLRSRMDRAAREAQADAQLEALKKKMGK